MGVTYRTIEVSDKAINKLKIISIKKNIDVRFKSLPFYLRGLHLRYKYKDKAHWLKVNEFIYGIYGTLEVSAELLSCLTFPY